MSTARTAMLAAAAIGVAIVSSSFALGMGPGNCWGQGRGMGCGGMSCGMMGGGAGCGRQGGVGTATGPVARLCAREIETHCAQVQHGPAMRSCLEGKSSELSENCRTALSSTAPDRGRGTGPVAHLCVKEISRFCSEVEHVAGQVRTCLEKHKGELGEGCVVALDTTGCRWRR